MKMPRRLEKETPQTPLGVSLSSDSEELCCSDRHPRKVKPSSASSEACAEADEEKARLE